MIVLYILLALFLFVLLLLFCNISFIFELKDSFTFKLRILFVTLKGERILQFIESGDEKKEKLQDEKIQNLKKNKKKRTLSDTIDLVLFILDLIKEIFGQFVKYAKLKVCFLDIRIATDDAAETALVYGVASSAVYSGLEFIDSLLTLKKNYKKITIYPDFTTTESKANLKIVLKLKPIHLILALMHLLPLLANGKKGK